MLFPTVFFLLASFLQVILFDINKVARCCLKTLSRKTYLKSNNNTGDGVVALEHSVLPHTISIVRQHANHAEHQAKHPYRVGKVQTGISMVATDDMMQALKASPHRVCERQMSGRGQGETKEMEENGRVNDTKRIVSKARNSGEKFK